MTRERAGIGVLIATLAAAMVLLIVGAPAITGAYLIAGALVALWLMRWN